MTSTKLSTGSLIRASISIHQRRFTGFIRNLRANLGTRLGCYNLNVLLLSLLGELETKDTRFSRRIGVPLTLFFRKFEVVHRLIEATEPFAVVRNANHLEGVESR